MVLTKNIHCHVSVENTADILDKVRCWNGKTAQSQDKDVLSVLPDDVDSLGL